MQSTRHWQLTIKEHKESRRKDIINSAEICEHESKNPIQRINETKNWFFEKVSRTDKQLTIFIRKHRRRSLINRIINKGGHHNRYFRNSKGH